LNSLPEFLLTFATSLNKGLVASDIHSKTTVREHVYVNSLALRGIVSAEKINNMKNEI